MKLLGELMGLVVLAIIRLGGSYTIQYYDCNNVNQIKTYRMDDTCMKSTAVKIPRITKQTILQKKTSLKLHGFSCKMVRSTITEYCGSFGHGKLAKPPELEIATVQTPETCLNMVNTQI